MKARIATMIEERHSAPYNLCPNCGAKMYDDVNN